MTLDDTEGMMVNEVDQVEDDHLLKGYLLKSNVP